MADILRNAAASWSGDLQSGAGTVSTGSEVLTEATVTYPSRFESGTGTNPEELIAAAHASCFSMALALGLSRQGHAPQALQTQATLTLRKDQSGFKITKVHLAVEGTVTDITAETFAEAANQAKENCPVSVLLKPGLEELTLDARLIS